MYDDCTAWVSGVCCRVWVWGSRAGSGAGFGCRVRVQGPGAGLGCCPTATLPLHCYIMSYSSDTAAEPPLYLLVLCVVNCLSVS